MKVTANKASASGKTAVAVPHFHNARAKPRKPLVWPGVLQTARGPLRCLVADICAEGAKLSQASPVAAGLAVTLVVAGVGTFRGEIFQTDGLRWGIKFAPETVVLDGPAPAAP